MIIKFFNWVLVAFWMIAMLLLKYPLVILMEVQEFAFDRLAYSLAKTNYGIGIEIENKNFESEPFDHRQEQQQMLDSSSLKWRHADNV